VVSHIFTDHFTVAFTPSSLGWGSYVTTPSSLEWGCYICSAPYQSHAWFEVKNDSTQSVYKSGFENHDVHPAWLNVALVTSF
jgi:hypothetical protein